MDLTLKKFLSSTNFTRYRAFRNQYNFFFFLKKLLLLNLFIEQNCALSRKILYNRSPFEKFPDPNFSIESSRMHIESFFKNFIRMRRTNVFRWKQRLYKRIRDVMIV